MARSLTFSFQGSSFDCEIHKVDRSKLYGQVSLETLDNEKRRCNLATLAYDGRTVIPHGGTALGYMNPDGEWLTRSDLTAVNLEGENLEEAESSFKVTIDLATLATPEEYLNHSVRLCYQLQGDIDPACLQQLQQGSIFKFSFSYRGGVSIDPAFVLASDDAIWMMVTDINQIDFVNLSQVAVCNRVDEPEESKEDSEELDFGML